MISEKKQAKRKRIRPFYKKAIAEGTFVLTGILAAFIVDASWDNWQEGKAEAQRLSALKEELIEGQKLLLENEAGYRRQDSLVREVLIEIQSPDVSYRRLDTLLFRIGPFWDYIPTLIAYRDATQGGNLSRIKSIELRHALGSYISAVEQLIKTHALVRQHFYNEMSPLWGEFTNVRQQIATREYFSSYPKVTLASRYDELIKDLRFSNHFVERGIFLSHVQFAANQVKESTSVLLESLENYK